MARAIKTTVYLEKEDYERIKGIARAESRLPAELVREALSQYVERKGAKRRPKSIGSGHSRKGDVAARAEELLEGMGRT
jgi:predicted transcriptional regulator